jgi:hypothetical protein
VPAGRSTTRTATRDWLAPQLCGPVAPDREWLNRGLLVLEVGLPSSVSPLSASEEGARMPVTIGVDPHKTSHPAAALDKHGRLLDHQRVPATLGGYQACAGGPNSGTTTPGGRGRVWGRGVPPGGKAGEPRYRCHITMQRAAKIPPGHPATINLSERFLLQATLGFLARSLRPRSARLLAAGAGHLRPPPSRGAGEDHPSQRRASSAWFWSVPWARLERATYCLGVGWVFALCRPAKTLVGSERKPKNYRVVISRSVAT